MKIIIREFATQHPLGVILETSLQSHIALMPSIRRQADYNDEINDIY